MAAQNEVELIVRAKNLSTRTINQLNDELSKIADNQEQVADANRLAERSFESLKSEQQQLLAIMKSLNDRASKLDAYSRQEQLLRSLRDETSSAGELARQVAQDVTLVAHVIREVNSPYYRATAPIANIEGALMLLGQNGLRMLLARVAFRPLIGTQSGHLARRGAPQLWRQSEQCALAASMAAPARGADPFEATLAGLMQNVGLVVALRLMDGLAGAAPLPPSDAFARALLDSARRLSAGIAQLWEFPPAVGQAILQAGRFDATPLAAALHQGERLATLRVLCDDGIPEALQLAASLSEAERRIFDRMGPSAK